MIKKKSSTESGYLQPLIHIIVWGAFFVFPILLSPNDEPDWKSLLLRHILPLGFSVLLFYFNYFYLIRKFLFESKIAWFLICNAVLIVILIISFDWFKNVLFYSEVKVNPHKPFKSFFYFRIFISYLLPVGISVAIRSTQRFFETQIEQQNRTNELLKTELQYLHYQMQPHFLFNSLNTIYSLINSEPDRAQKALHQLSKLMRYVLYDASADRVSIQKEAEFLDNYILLMQERQGHLFNLNKSFHIERPDLKLAPLLLIPLVENAFKHSVGAKSKADLSIEINQQGNELILEVSNTSNPAAENDKSESGIGLENLKKRLEMLYPGKHQLLLGLENSVFKARLRILI